jgi:hypothetical protein
VDLCRKDHSAAGALKAVRLERNSAPGSSAGQHRHSTQGARSLTDPWAFGASVEVSEMKNHVKR